MPIASIEPRPSVALVMRVEVKEIIAVQHRRWTYYFDSADETRRAVDWLSERAVDVTLACRLAYPAAFGDLEARMRREMLERAQRQREKEAKRLRRQRKKLERARVIDSSAIDMGGQFGLDLRRGDAKRGFWCILFRERWERERFLDWFRFQRQRFSEFAEFLESHDAIELDRMLLREMMETERRVKAAGLAAGGRRPLRFWRGE